MGLSVTPPTTTNDDTPNNNEAYWLRLAQAAIALEPAYADATITWMAHTHNAVFHVQNGPHLAVLTLYKHDVSLSRLQSEDAWLRAISEQTELVVGRPIKLLTIDDTQTGKTIQGALRDYVDGAPKAPLDLTIDDMARIGGFLAQLHHFSEQYEPPADFDRPHLDYDGLFGEGGTYDPGEAIAVFTAHQLDIINQTTERIRTAMNEIGQDAADFGLIHGDMLSKNILFHEGDIRAIDWEFSGWGYYLYDMTPLLWQIKSQANYDELAAALWSGYTSERPLPAHYGPLLDTFIAARQVASMRWLASNLDHPMVKGHAQTLIQQRTQELQDFLATGKLRRQSITL